MSNCSPDGWAADVGGLLCLVVLGLLPLIIVTAWAVRYVRSGRH